ncbi:glycosyltransferase family 2 protein [Chondrinema litorale]|uniref:glycosyltransferase family 2 protein n=1 Tax=Chondrinema litorale TaxID=2994555 RepID=UPI002542B85A|nr:glycosyltransferase [Chondrinema litorale]UZR98023.1 glycosyltransferase [Chondrinema litorale]
MDSKLKISVVVATYNRSDLLIELIKSLDNQTLDKETYEIIIACDGCTDDTIEKLEFQSYYVPNLKWLDLPKGNPAKSRNAGILEAKAPLIAFTDDDCLAENTWLETIIKVFDKKDTIGLQGKTTTDKKLVNPLTHQIENLKGHPSVPTCNAAFRKNILLKIGGFDEHFPFAHNEDADLSWRIRSEGKIDFVPEMVINHPPRKVSFTKMLDRMKILESEFMLYHKNPELYKFWRNENPWKTIYTEVFLKHQLLIFKSRFKYINRPLLMIKGIMISLIWWIDLLLKYPSFLKADQLYKKKYSELNILTEESNLAA